MWELQAGARLELKCEAVVALAVVALAGFAAAEYLAYCDSVPAVDVADPIIDVIPLHLKWNTEIPCPQMYDADFLFHLLQLLGVA